MTMKLANPLYYPLAVLAGSITLFTGVRLANLPSVVMVPLAALVATGGAMVQKSREPESFNLDNPELERELLSIRTSAKLLADRANLLREEAAKLLSSSLELELLGIVQYACDRVLELPGKIDGLARRFSGSDSLLSVKDLQQQLTEVQVRLEASRGVAKEQLQKLAESLQRNIQLAEAGQDARQAQVLSLSTLIADSAGVLQALQNKLRTADLSNSTETMELRSLSNELDSFQENVDILLGK
jgi:hypothetical protein